MTTLLEDNRATPVTSAPRQRERSQSAWALALQSTRVRGAAASCGILLLCRCHALVDEGLVRSKQRSGRAQTAELRQGLAAARVDGLAAAARAVSPRRDHSLAVGLAAAAISVFLGVTVASSRVTGAGCVDAVLRRTVDVLYGCRTSAGHPLQDRLRGPAGKALHQGVRRPGEDGRQPVVLFAAIGLVSWLTMARGGCAGRGVSLRRSRSWRRARRWACPQRRIFLRHILPNLVGPITVYAPSPGPPRSSRSRFLSFLGIGVQPPLPTWGSGPAGRPGAQPHRCVLVDLLVLPCLLLW